MRPTDYGHVLHYPVVVRGLQELCPDLHFDLHGAQNHWAPRIAEFAGVFYNGRHICGMDRGEIPEFKVWSVQIGAVEIPPDQVAALDGSWVTFREVLPEEPEYAEGLLASEHYDRGYAFEDGKLKHYRGWKVAKQRGRILKIGWRHTFERILLFGVPGVTRSSLAQKFKVDMLKYPKGSPEEIFDALIAEPSHA